MLTGETVKTGSWICGTVLAVGLLAGGFVVGADKKPDETPTKLKGKLPAHFKKLGLSDQQTQQIFKIEAEYNEKILALQRQLADLKKAEHHEIDGVLTAEQKTHLREILTGEIGGNDKPAPPAKDKPTVKDKPKDK